MPGNMKPRIMKLLISILAFINGGYMLLDGIYVMIKGKYIGPDKPGPWANLFYKSGISVFNLGPLFIILGIGWFIFLYALWTGQSWAWLSGIIMSILTLWYLPVGTLLAVIILIVLLTLGQRPGI